MKPIGRKELIEKVRAGEVDRKALRHLRQSAEPDDFDLDEREPIERVADELETFSKSLLNMSTQQAEAMSKMLNIVMLAVNNISDIKVNIPETKTQEQINQWDIKVVKRSAKGLIEQITLTGE